MPDTEVRAVLSVVGADAALQSLRAFRQELTASGAAHPQVTVTADTRAAMADLSQVETVTKRIDNTTVRAKVDIDASAAEAKLDSLSTKLAGWVGRGAALFAGAEMARGIGVAADAIVGFNGKLEQTRVAFTSALGSASAANQFITQLQEFAARTPFDFEDVTRLSQRLLAVGFSSKEIIPDLTAMGNAVAAVGGNGETLDRITLALGQMRNSAHLSSQDMNQLVQANIPAWQLLADAIGQTQAKTRELTEKGQISGVQASQAILEGLQSRNLGLMEQQSQTFLGRLENFRDTTTQQLAQMGVPLFDELSKGLEKAAAAVASPKFQQFAGDMIKDMTAVVKAGEAVAEVLGKIPTPVIEAAVHLAEFAVAVKAMGAAVEFTKGVLEPVITLIGRETTATIAATSATEANTAATKANNAALSTGIDLLGKAATAFAAYQIVGKPAQDAIMGAANKLERPQADLGTLNTEDEATFEAGIKARLEKQQKIVDEYNAYKGSAGYNINKVINLGGELQSDADYKKALENIAALKKAEEDYHKAHAQTVADVTQGVSASGYDPVTVNANEAISAMEQLAAKEKEAAEYRRRGASESDIQRGVFGQLLGGGEATSYQQQAAKKNLDDLVTAQKQALDAITAAQKAGAADVAAAQKQHSADIVAAAKEAQSAIGSIDLGSGGVTGLAGAATQLDDIRAKLAALGQESAHLNALAALANQFKTITDATDAATLATRAFNLTLDQTNKSISALGSLKSEYLSALEAAEKRQAQGTASQSDLDIIRARSTALSGIDQQTAALQQRANVDVLGKLNNLPDYVKADDTMRDMIAQFPGGQKQLMLDVQTNVDKAKEELQAVTNEPWKTTITATVQYQTADGKAIASPVAFGDAAGGGAGLMPEAGATGGAGGGPLGYRSLSQSQYSQIVTSGPIANAQGYAALNAAAQEQNIDPRALLAFMKYENNFGTNISASQLAGNNLGGIKFAGQPGATPGATSPEGDPYAAFNTLQSYFAAMARNLTTGSYAADYASGNLTGIRQRYVAGSATPSSAQQANIAGTVSYYQGLTQDYPGSGQSVDQAASGVRDQIVQQALKSVNIETLVGYCEQFVEQSVEAITGQRGATGQREQSATTAFQHAQQMGLETRNPQPGDLVYYPDANGGPGHVAVYKGHGEQISTADVGGRAVHVEPVGANARYVSVSVPGQGEGGGAGVPAGGNAVAAAAASIARATTGASGVAQAAASAADLQKALEGANRELARLDNPSIKAAHQALSDILPVLTEMQGKKLFGDAGPLNATEQQQAVGAAWQQGFQYEEAYAQLLADIINNTGDLATDTQRVANIVGGPMAAAYGQAALASARIAAATAETSRLTKEHDAVVQQRQATDQAQSRAQTMAGWASQDTQQAMQRRQQAAQEANQAAQAAENARFTRVQRDEQDRQRQLAFSQQVQATDLQNQLQDVQKRQQQGGYQRTAQEQLLERQVGGAPTNAIAAQGAANLAALHERDLAQKDADAREIDAIQDKIRLQAKQASLDSFNLESETIAEQRKHEDIMASLAAQSAAQQRTFAAEQQAEQEHQQAIQRSTQLQQWQEQDRRQAEDTSYQAAIDAQKQIAESAQASLDAANQAITAWQQTGQVITTAASTAAQQATSLLQASSLSQYPNTGAIRNLGGKAAGGEIPVGASALVGDAPGGGVTPFTERVTVTPHGAVVQPLTDRPASGGNTFNIGVSIAAGSDDDAVIAEAMRRFESRLRAGLAAARNAGRNQRSAIGAN